MGLRVKGCKVYSRTIHNIVKLQRFVIIVMKLITSASMHDCFSLENGEGHKL